MVLIRLNVAFPAGSNRTPEGESFFCACYKMQEKGHKTIIR